MPPSSCTRLMLRLTTRSSCLPEASTYSPRQVPDRSCRAGAVVVASVEPVGGTALAALSSADGAAAGSTPERGSAVGGAAGSVDVGVCVSVDACACVNPGLL